MQCIPVTDVEKEAEVGLQECLQSPGGGAREGVLKLAEGMGAKHPHLSHPGNFITMHKTDI